METPRGPALGCGSHGPPTSAPAGGAGQAVTVLRSTGSEGQIQVCLPAALPPRPFLSPVFLSGKPRLTAEGHRSTGRLGDHSAAPA